MKQRRNIHNDVSRFVIRVRVLMAGKVPPPYHIWSFVQTKTWIRVNQAVGEVVNLVK